MPKLVVCCLLIPSVALAAELVEIPLAIDEDGLYVRGVDHDYALPFDAARELQAVSGVRLRLVGTYDCLETFCWQDGGIGGGVASTCYDPGIDYGVLDGEVKRHEASHRFADISGGVELVAFTIELSLAPDPADPAWEMLADGVGTVYLRGWQCPFVPYPTICMLR